MKKVLMGLGIICMFSVVIIMWGECIENKDLRTILCFLTGAVGGYTFSKVALD